MEEDRISKRVERIPIDSQGKQLLVLRGVAPERAAQLVETLSDWLESDACVLVIHLDDEADLKLLKVENSGA